MHPEIILGSPGCGKTTALLRIVEEELTRGIPPDRIGYFTFTRRAAEESVSRALTKFNLTRLDFPYFRTLHALCYRQLGLRSGDVMNQTKLATFGDYAGVKITGRWSEDGTLSGFEVGDRILFMENLARVRMISLREQYDQDDDNLSWLTVDRVARSYAAWKEAHGLVDFTDMLYQYLKSGIELRLEVVLDDEAQDQSLLQWAVLRKLATGARRVVIAGDDDQAIYSWAGADVATLIDLPGIVSVLGQSWRVPETVQRLAQGIIERIPHRRLKDWSPRSAPGRLAYLFNFDDADCSAGELLILARNVYLLRETIAPALRRAGIIYEYQGHSSVSSNILEAISAWEKLRAGGAVPVSQARLIYEYMSIGRAVTRGFKKLPMFTDDETVDLAGLKARGGLLVDTIWHEALDKLPPDEMGYLLAARKRGERLQTKPRVRISTIHSAKGAEADHVILLKEIARRTWREMERDEDAERRCFYVGVTRAREQLTIVEASTQQACPWI